MFATRLKLPANFTELEIARLSDGIETSAQTALRDENHNRAPWTLEWLFDTAPDLESLKTRIILNAEIQSLALPEHLSFETKEIADRDWLSYSYKQFPPFEIGPFFIYGSHHDGDIPPSQIGLQIDAATAFGSGEHLTTKGCLEAMVYLKDQGLCPWNILDMGTGSGILAIAAWKLWKTPILAIDNDPESIALTERHIAQNKIPDELCCALGDGLIADNVQQKKPFELIIANILAGPLKEMAKDLADVLDENGYTILSGILNEQADEVIAVYAAQNLALTKHNKIGDWSTLILHNTTM